MEATVNIDGKDVHPIVKCGPHPFLPNMVSFTLSNGNLFAITYLVNDPSYGLMSLKTAMSLLWSIEMTPQHVARIFDTWEIFKEAMDIIGVKIGESMLPIFPKEFTEVCNAL